MKPDVAYATGQAYAWGYQDATNTKDSGVSYAFAVAYAEGYRKYDAAEIGYMTSVQSAYATWRASNGRTIFHAELTPDEIDAAYPDRVQARASTPPTAREGSDWIKARDADRVLFGSTSSNAELRAALTSDTSVSRPFSPTVHGSPWGRSSDELAPGETS